jgi:hypothetical protein
VRTYLSFTGAIALISCALTAPASALPLFDMEGVAPGFYAGSLMVVDGPLTLTVTPEGNSSGFVAADDSGVPLLGSVALIGSNTNPLQAGQSTPLRFSFDQAIDSITFNFGDAGGDDDGMVEIRAYSTGDMFDTLLGSVSDIYPANFADGKSLTLDFAGADYYVARTFDNTNENSIYWDIGAITAANVVVTEPSSWAMMLAGLLGLGGGVLRRARHKRTTRASAVC